LAAVCGNPVGRNQVASGSWSFMNIQIALQPVIAVIAGLLILMIPRLLNYIVALYLIITGILALLRV
jgi:hypothetical protein